MQTFRMLLVLRSTGLEIRTGTAIDHLRTEVCIFFLLLLRPLTGRWVNVLRPDKAADLQHQLTSHLFGVLRFLVVAFVHDRLCSSDSKFTVLVIEHRVRCCLLRIFLLLNVVVWWRRWFACLPVYVRVYVRMYERFVGRLAGHVHVSQLQVF